MEPLAVDLLLLRDAAPELPLAVGRVLAARVVERHGPRHGILNLAGAYLTAELPEEVQPGDRLRLVVQETTAERVVLRLAEQPVPPPIGPEAPRQARLPQGGALTVLGREGGGKGAARAVTLRYETPALGPVELRIALHDHAVRTDVALDDGPPLALAVDRAAELQAALAEAARRPAEVRIAPRRDPLDVYA